MQDVFKRYELKYMITKEQKEKLLKAMEPYMALDKYGRTTIRNIYFDTVVLCQVLVQVKFGLFL